MTKLPKVQAPWDLVTSALHGTLVGLMTAVTYNYVEAFYGDIPNEDVVESVLTETTLFVLTGAILFALVSAICNSLRGEP